MNARRAALGKGGGLGGRAHHPRVEAALLQRIARCSDGVPKEEVVAPEERLEARGAARGGWNSRTASAAAAAGASERQREAEGKLTLGRLGPYLCGCVPLLRGAPGQ